MGVFDSVKAKITGAQKGLSDINSITGGVGDIVGTATKGTVDTVLNNSAVKNGLGLLNQANNLYQNVTGLIGAAKSFLNDPYQVVPNPLLGGYSRKEVQKLTDKAIKTAYAKNNLFLVRLQDPNYYFNNEAIDEDNNFLDLFAMGVSYNPIAITGDTVKLGLLHGDNIQQSERVEIRMTFFDDAVGSIKQYLMFKKNKMVSKDGTGIVPIDYAITITIIQLNQMAGAIDIGFGEKKKRIGFFSEDELIKQSLFKQTYHVRLSTLDIDLNKREDSLQELQVTFTEIDPFMRVE